jgi:4-hydroxybenzoate polyprenyltransferase
MGTQQDRVELKSDTTRERISVVSTKADHWISAIAHSIAVSSIAVAGGYAFRFLMLAHFWIGAVFGVVIYAVACAATWLPDG